MHPSKIITMPRTLLLGLASLCVSVGCSTTVADRNSNASPKASSPTQASRNEEAEVVTGSRIPVRGAQPVRTIDKDEITRNTSVIGTPPKGN